MTGLWRSLMGMGFEEICIPFVPEIVPSLDETRPHQVSFYPPNGTKTFDFTRKLAIFIGCIHVFQKS